MIAPAAITKMPDAPLYAVGSAAPTTATNARSSGGKRQGRNASKHIDASWTREQLGLALRFPDYRRGLAEIWRHDGPALAQAAKVARLERTKP